MAERHVTKETQIYSYLYILICGKYKLLLYYTSNQFWIIWIIQLFDKLLNSEVKLASVLIELVDQQVSAIHSRGG